MKILKRKKALQAESGGLRGYHLAFEGCIHLMKSMRRVLHWGKQRQKAEIEWCEVGERALETWCMRIWRHVSIDLRQNLRERTWMPDLPLEGLGHLAREVGGLCVETAALTLRRWHRLEPPERFTESQAPCLVWEEARWSRGSFNLPELVHLDGDSASCWVVGDALRKKPVAGWWAQSIPLQTINEDLSHIWAEPRTVTGEIALQFEGNINHLINRTYLLVKLVSTQNQIKQKHEDVPQDLAVTSAFLAGLLGLGALKLSSQLLGLQKLWEY